MRFALTLGFTLVLLQAVPAQAAGNAGESLPVASTVDASQPENPSGFDGPESPASVSPRVLSSADIALYRKIFAAENKGQKTKADKLLEKTSDPILKGYAQAVLLLSPRRATLAELKNWLSRYRDLAIADRVYGVLQAHTLVHGLVHM